MGLCGTAPLSYSNNFVLRLAAHFAFPSNKHDNLIMKLPVACSFCTVLISVLAQGETFIGPTTATNRLLVATNSAIIITTTLGDFTNSTQVVLDGYQFSMSYFAPLESGNSYALAGPAELIFSNAIVISYYQITNSSIRTQSIANDPIGIPIASNKTMRLFGVPAVVNASFSRAGSSSASFTLEPGRPAEFTGPGTLFLNSGVLPPDAKFISYFIAEDGFTLPDQRAITGPTGSYAITVEKSSDLNTWSPAFLQNTSDDGRAFYRLRIQR